MIEFAPNPVRHTPAPRLSCRQLAVQRLADAICELAGSHEPITQEALEARNIPPALADKLRDDALAVARRRFVKGR